MSRIELNVVATGNFRNLETSVARLRTQVDALNASMLGVGFSSGLGKSLSAFQDQFNATIDQSGMFERHMVNLTTETTRFGRSLESGSMRLGQLFRTATEYRRGELGQIRQLAREQVRLMNATTMGMADGGTQVIVPRGIDEGIERQRILNQEYRIFRQVVQNGSTEIINWGKNTQWAGRQLTVGLTVPLTLFGAAAGKMFMDADKQLTRMAKVYGDATKGMVDPAELSRIRSETLALSQEIARSMGVAVGETLSIAADIAATGKEGNELLASTREAMRLSVLGEVDRQEAMRATLAIQSVFKKDTEGLTQSINLLNAVENQTSATIDDLVTGIVKAGPVVQGLGGDVEDLAAMMVAMREGGIPASEAANAIKSSLASLINPTKQTTQVLGDFGINIKSIVDKNAGDVIGTLVDLQSELSNLDELSRQRSIEQIFGKFQFSRINALLANLGKAGSQTEQVFAIANMSVAELAKNAELELTAVTESAAGKFQRAVETIKANLIPIGEVFVQAGTIILNIGNKILEVFNSLPDPVKNIVNGILGLTAVAGPIIMITGVLGNFFGYLVKGLSTIMAFKKEGRGAFELLTVDSIAARDANELLSDSLYDQATAMSTMASAVDTLVKKLQDLVNNLKDVRTQTTGLNLDAPARQALAAAEVSAAGSIPMAYGAPSGRYIPRRNTPSEIMGPDLFYSHISQESFMKGLLPEGQRDKVLGVGTVVDKKFSELNRLLASWFLDFSQLDDETVTTLQRRRAIIDAARAKLRTGSMTTGSYEQIIEIVNSMNSGELASFAPTWQAIAKGTAQYSGTLKSMAELMPQKTAEVTELWDQYRRELSMFGEEKALVNLKNGLRSLGAAVDQHIEDISQDIADLVMSVRNLPESERPEALQRGLAGIVSRTEGAAVTGPVGSLTGIGDPDKGYGRAMMLGAQQIIKTEQMLATASQQTITEYEKVDAALEEASLIQEEINSIAEQSKQAEKNILDAKKKAESAWKNTFVDDQGRRFYGTPEEPGRAVPAAQVEKRQAQEQEAQASLELLNQQQLELEERKRSAEERKAQSDEEVARRRRVAEESYQTDLELIGATEEVIAATRELAATRKRKASTKDELEVVEEELEAATRLQSEKREQLTRAENEALLASTRSKEVRERLEANRARAAQELIEAETRLALITEKRAALVEQSILLGRELTQEEKELAILRERQSADVTQNIVSTEKDSISTARAAQAEEEQRRAALKNAGVTDQDTAATGGSRGGGLFAGGKIGGAISLASMAALFLPRPSDDTGAGQAMSAGMNILNIASLGAGFGGPGIAIGAGIGAAIEGIKFLGRKAEEEAAAFEELRMQTNALKNGLTDLERSFFEIDPLKGLEDGALGGFKLRTQEATDRLREFALAVKNAETGTIEAGRRDAISQMSTAEEFINNPMFSKMVSEALLGGKSIEDIKIMLGGYLDAAGKEVFAPLVNAELTRIGKLGKKPEEIGARYLAQLQSIANRVIESAGYEERTGALRVVQQDYERKRAGRSITVTDEAGNETNANLADVATFLKDTAERNNTTLQEYIDYLTAPEGSITAAPAGIEEVMSNLKIDGETMRQNKDAFDFILSSASSLIAISPDLAGVKDIMGAIGNESQLMADGIENALGSGAEIFDEFLRSLGHTADSMNENTQLISEMSSRIGQVSTSAKTAFDVMISNGVELQDALRIVSMLMSDAGTDWAQLADLALANPINFRNIIWTEYVTGGNPTPGSVPSQGATGSEDVGSRLAGTIDYSAGGGGGSSGSDYYDKLIEAQDKIIEGIQKEREERQKLLDIQEKQMDFALRRQDLENQIARAMAEGNLAEAALLQAELDAEQKKYDNEELERKRQEREDKKIEAAEKEKERLSKLKEAASGGGGGSAGGVSESQKQWTANRIEILSTGVVNWTAGAELRSRTAEMGPYSAFFESEKVKQYREELLRLGVPLEDINRELNNMFDSWIDNNSQLFAQTDDYKFIEDSLKNMGVAGEDLKEVMPDVFGALLDKELNPKEKIDVIASALYDLGYETDEAYRKAKKMYEQYNKDFDGKGIDDELKNWLELNNRIRAARKQLKLYQEGKGGPVTADQAERTAQRAAGQEPGVPAPGTINAGGVQIDPESVGVDMIDGVVLGWTGQAPQAVLEIQSIAKTLLGEFAKEAGVESPSWKYKLIGKDMIAGLIEGLTLPEDNVTGVISTLNDTFKAAADSYKVLFGDPTNGIAGVMDQEVTLASDNFFTKMTTRMQETVDEINRIVGGIKDYQFSIIGNPKIYTGGAPDIWTRVFQNVPTSMFTNELPKYNTGGYVEGPGGPTEDKILARLSDGEYVVKASSVDKYGTGLLDAINNKKFANGGYISADRAEYAASRRPTYFGGTPTSSTGYNRPANNPAYSGGTPTWSGGYTDANYQSYSKERDKGRIQTIAGANWSWDSSKGKWVKLADVKTGAAASGFGLIASGFNQSLNQSGFWGTLGMMASSIIEDPSMLLPFVGSNKIDTSTQEGKDMFAASSLLDIVSVVPGMTGFAALGRMGMALGKSASRIGARTSASSSVRTFNPAAHMLDETGRTYSPKMPKDMLADDFNFGRNYPEGSYPTLYSADELASAAQEVHSFRSARNQERALAAQEAELVEQAKRLHNAWLSGALNPRVSGFNPLDYIPRLPTSPLKALMYAEKGTKRASASKYWNDWVRIHFPRIGLAEELKSGAVRGAENLSDIEIKELLKSVPIVSRDPLLLHGTSGPIRRWIDPNNLQSLKTQLGPYGMYNSNSLIPTSTYATGATTHGIFEGQAGAILKTRAPKGKNLDLSAGGKKIPKEVVDIIYNNLSGKTIKGREAVDSPLVNATGFSDTQLVQLSREEIEDIINTYNKLSKDPVDRIHFINEIADSLIGNSYDRLTNATQSGLHQEVKNQFAKSLSQSGYSTISHSGGSGSHRVSIILDPTQTESFPIYNLTREGNNYVGSVPRRTGGGSGKAGLALAATAPLLGAWSAGETLGSIINPGALAALGITAASLSPLGRRILTMPYHAVRNRGIMNNMIHLNTNPITGDGPLNPIHPKDVPTIKGRASGPGLYTSDRRNTRASDMFRGQSIHNPSGVEDWYAITAGVKERTRLNWGWDRWASKEFYADKLRNKSWDSRQVQKLRKRGIVGLHERGYTTLFDYGIGNKWQARSIAPPSSSSRLKKKSTPRVIAELAMQAQLLGIPLQAYLALAGLGFYADGGLVKVGQDNLTLLGEGISNYAKKFTGTPYSSSAAWADGPKNGWGCATATKWLYDSYAGVDVGHPSLSASQYSSSAGSRVTDKMPGDLLFFYYPNGVNTSNPINHVGMYTGNGSMFHARSPELGTQVTGIDELGMDRARTRAGGSAIKRYMPMTIAGMGVPAGKLAKGGKVYGKGGPTTDEVLAWISNGEYVMNAGAVRHYGKEFMDAVNKGILPEAAMGGMFSSKYPGVVQKMAGGGMLMSKYGKGGMVSSSANVEYNINVNVAGTNASPDEIANKVMQTIKRSDKMKGATVRI